MQIELPNIKYCVGIAAGKGGVGKSTLTILLAYGLSQKGYAVGILDADIYGPSIPYMLGIEKPSEGKDGFVIPAKSKGISFFSFAFVNESHAALRAPIANRVIEQCANEIAWGELDFLLVDFPPGTGDVQLTALQTLGLSGMLYISTSQEVALLDVDKAYQMGVAMDIPTIGFVENMSYLVDTDISPFGRGNVVRYAEAKEERFLGEIPLDPKLCEALDRGNNPFEKSSDRMKDIVRHLADEVVASVDQVEEPFVCNIQWKEEYATSKT